MTNPPQLPRALVEFQEQAKARPEFHPETSPLLHADLYEYLIHRGDKGYGLIEIGCYTGASSIVLAYVGQQLCMPFWTIDINPTYLDFTRKLLSELGLAEQASFFQGTMAEFVTQWQGKKAPLMIFVDGDHNYTAVRKDIQAVNQLTPRPYAIAFHDFSLRSYRYENIRVDQAILDEFGDHIPYRRIGVQFGERPVPSWDKPSASGSYWEVEGTEGVIIELEALQEPQL